MKVTANRSDEEPNRITRLTRIAGVLQNNGVADFVSAIHDHKGTLYVNWLGQPTTENLVSVVDAWRTENEIASNHYVNGAPLIWDTDGANPFGGRET